jgi:hypothetical protein
MNPTLAFALAVVMLGALALAGGGVLATAVFRQVDRHGERHRDRQGGSRATPREDAGPGAEESESVEAAREILRGGAWIGVLERAAVYSTIVAGWPEGIAVVLAVKGLARYPELQTGRKSAAAERFIIGTFVSTLFAAACAGLTLWVRAAVA